MRSQEKGGLSRVLACSTIQPKSRFTSTTFPLSPQPSHLIVVQEISKACSTLLISHYCCIEVTPNSWQEVVRNVRSPQPCWESGAPKNHISYHSSHSSAMNIFAQSHSSQLRSVCVHIDLFYSALCIVNSSVKILDFWIGGSQWMTSKRCVLNLDIKHKRSSPLDKCR